MNTLTTALRPTQPRALKTAHRAAQRTWENILGPTEQKIYRELNNRIRYHINATKKQSSIYHWTTRGLQWTIPVLAATLTVFTGREGIGVSQGKDWFAHWGSWLVFALSGLLTVLTVVNSTIRPAERYAFAVDFSNQFWMFHTQLQLELEKTLLKHEKDPEKKEKRDFDNLLARKNREIVRLIEDFNRGSSLLSEGARGGQPQTEK